ncbi:MAG: hypothetical protein [Podoviridae sp. ctda_1]|nr:MAG: hypothetical protein [Podoviridae sp. ctda_1]
MLTRIRIVRGEDPRHRSLAELDEIGHQVAVEVGLDLTVADNTLDLGFELTDVGDIDADLDRQATAFVRERADRDYTRLALHFSRRLGDLVHGPLTLARRDDVEVFGVRERGLTAEAEATSLIIRVGLGGSTVGTVDLAHLAVRDTRTIVGDGQDVVDEADVDRLVGAAAHDVGVPCIADDFTADCKDLILVQRLGQHVHQVSTIVRRHFDCGLTTDHGMRDGVALMHYFHYWFSRGMCKKKTPRFLSGFSTQTTAISG